MAEADEFQPLWSSLIKTSLWMETLHLSASLPSSICLSDLPVAVLPTVYRSQSTRSSCSLQAGIECVMQRLIPLFVILLETA